MDLNEIKIGTCFSGQKLEGVIINIDDAKDEVHCIVNYVNDNRYFNRMYGSKEAVVRMRDMSIFDITYEPHFCSMANLFSVMKKHITKYEKIYLIGTANFRKINQGIMTDYVYFLTENNTIIELNICYPTQHMNYYVPYIWIKEFTNCNEVHFPDDATYYFNKDAHSIHVRYYNLFDKNSDVNGITFCEEMLKPLITIVSDYGLKIYASFQEQDKEEFFENFQLIIASNIKKGIQKQVV